MFTAQDAFIENSTFTGNSARANGGALYAYIDADVSLKHVTIADNSTSGSGAAISRFANYHNTRRIPTIRLYNSIIAGNSGGDCAEGLNRVVSSLIKDGSCSPTFSGDPHLGSLTTANSGQKYYPLLDSQSSAINTADSGYCTQADQLGRARPVGSACDIGAIENASGLPIPTMTNTPNEAQQRDLQLAVTAAFERSSCVMFATSYYLLFPESGFLAGRVPFYEDSACLTENGETQNNGIHGLVYTTGGIDSAPAICAAGNFQWPHL